jgi:hypothetical protein
VAQEEDKFVGNQAIYLSNNIFTCRGNAPNTVIQVQGTLCMKEGREDSSIQFTSSHVSIM